jgi:eukaryotic-like serine/threonine-protein kinase
MGILSARDGGYAFGRFRLSADGTLLVRDGQPVPLAPKVLKTLLALVERAGEVVKKADLLQAVWPDSFVEETGLSRNISLLRDALDDDAQTLIVTVARIGYRFSAPVVKLEERGGRGRLPAALSSTVRIESAGQAGPRSVTRLLILPFRLLRDDPETGFLAFSVPDAMIHALSAVPSLVVRSSAVAARFDRDAPDLLRMATEADVDAVLTGALMRSGERLRLIAQLSAVPCGRVLLSESLDLTISEVFDLQDRLVQAILDSLSLSPSAGDRRTSRREAPASAEAYEYFLRANECVGPQGLASAANLRIARELYGRALEEDRRFAPAWARLGRCLYLIGKTDDGERQSIARAESCFQEALAISPDLPLAHNLYAWVEIDQGRARSAMVRLISRALAGNAQPELFAALVQACRFCGLLEASAAAHDLARELDPTLATSAYQAWWQLGDHDRVLREGVRPWILEALIVGMRDDPGRAIELLRAREALGVTGLARHLMEGLRAVFEGRADAAYDSASRIFEAFPDPEAVFYAARYLAFFGERRALTELERALDRGFTLYRALLRDDPWLDPLRGTTEFQQLLQRARHAYREGLVAYGEANGVVLLGPVPTPEELETGGIWSGVPALT